VPKSTIIRRSINPSHQCQINLVIMNASDLTLFSGDNPSNYKHTDRSQCLKLLVSHLDSYRRSALDSNAVAELRFSNGVTLKFGIHDGRVDVLEMRPIIGHARKFLGVIPMPTRKELHNDSTDFEIQKIVARAFAS
jgi:hypothetical protein